MILYLYVSKNIMFDFLGRNIIAPNSVVEDKKGIRTLSTKSDNLLFVTHKKLNHKVREEGIADAFVYPITIELTDISEKDDKAILVSQTAEGVEYKYTKLNDYNFETGIGAYIIGEIPFSRINRILFDSKEDIEMFSRPSPDYWYPIDKYELLKEDEFTEEFNYEISEEKALADCGLNVEDIIKGIQKREKQRAATLNFINASRKWSYGKFEFSIDQILQEWLALTDEEVNTFLPHYTEMRSKNDNQESLTLFGNNSKEKTNINQFLYDSIVEKLVEVPFMATKNPETALSILSELIENLKTKCVEIPEKDEIEEALDDVYGFVSFESDKGIDEIIDSINGSIDSIKALLFVFKNPSNYIDFLQSLVSYGVDKITIRRSAVLWGYLNGLYGMPGENYNKDNKELWKYVEACTRNEETEMLPTLFVEKEKPSINSDKKTIIGILLKEEEIYTVEEIHAALIIADEVRLGAEFYDRLLEAAKAKCGSEKKAENQGYLQCRASITIPEIKEGDLMDSAIKKSLETLLKDFKSPKSNKEKLRKDFLENINEFKKLYDTDKNYWKALFKKVKG